MVDVYICRDNNDETTSTMSQSTRCAQLMVHLSRIVQWCLCVCQLNPVRALPCVRRSLQSLLRVYYELWSLWSLWRRLLQRSGPRIVVL